MRKPKLRTVVQAIVVVLAVAICVGPIVFVYVEMRGRGVPITSVRQLSPDVPLTFPADTIVIEGERHSGFGAYLVAKIRFGKSEVHGFISQPLLAANGTNVQSQLMNWESRTGKYDWKLKSIRKFWAIDNVECRPNDGNSQAYLLIDLDDPKYSTVYIDREYH